MHNDQIIPAGGEGLPAGIPESSCAPKPEHVFSTLERILLVAALALGILFDRLLIDPFFSRCAGTVARCGGAFWLCYLVVFYLLHWQRLCGNKVLWLVAGCSAALCCWNFFYGGANSYTAITYLVVPGVLMAHAVVFHGGYRLKQVAAIVSAWTMGWLVKPFSAVHMFFGASSSLFTGEKKSGVKKVLTAVAVSIPLLWVIVPLLGSADLVFAHYLDSLFLHFDLEAIFVHGTLIAVVAIFFYSFLWNTGFGEAKTLLNPVTVRLDSLVCSIVLGIVLSVYLLFCSVQFTYLFARAGLPINRTYSEYAREGFWQLIVIVAINLLIFGLLLQYAAHTKVLAAMLGTLLGETLIMLASSLIRLRLYITTYGMTWLRLLSAWFILYLAVVLVLCGVRMAKPRLPLIGVCALVLLGWYTALGYLNPEGFIKRYNDSHSRPETSQTASLYTQPVRLCDDAEYLSPDALTENAFRLLKKAGEARRI